MNTLIITDFFDVSLEPYTSVKTIICTYDKESYEIEKLYEMLLKYEYHFPKICSVVIFLKSVELTQNYYKKICSLIDITVITESYFEFSDYTLKKNEDDIIVVASYGKINNFLPNNTTQIFINCWITYNPSGLWSHGSYLKKNKIINKSLYLDRKVEYKLKKKSKYNNSYMNEHIQKLISNDIIDKNCKEYYKYVRGNFKFSELLENLPVGLKKIEYILNIEYIAEEDVEYAINDVVPIILLKLFNKKQKIPYGTQLNLSVKLSSLYNELPRIESIKTNIENKLNILSSNNVLLSNIVTDMHNIIK